VVPSGQTRLGETLTLFGLAPGRYIAVLTATDSDGMQGSAAISFSVGSRANYLPLIVK